MRKFDDDIDNELRVCETLYYHCMYNSLYISELTTAMKGIGLLPDNIKECSYILKEDFKRDIIYNNGLVFENERVVQSRKQITELLPSVRTKDYEIDLSSGATSIVNLLAPSSDGVKTLERVSTKSFTIGQIAERNYSIVHKALRQFNIFKFDILQQYYPNLKSTKQFITDSNYLGNIKINIKISNDEITNEQLYIACKRVVEKISNVEVYYRDTELKEGEEAPKDKDGNVSFDPTKVTEDIQMSADLVLSDKQLGAVANNYLNTIIDQALKEEELSSIGAINIVQLKIFDINEDASGYSSAKVNIVIKVDLTQFKKNFTVFPLNLINKYIPNILYINSTNTITMTADFLYTINYESLTLNNLNSKQSSSILQLLNKFISIGSSQEVGETIGEYFCDTVIGSTQSQEGLGYALKPAGAKKCSFRQIENIGYFVISITTGIS